MEATSILCLIFPAGNIMFSTGLRSIQTGTESMRFYVDDIIFFLFIHFHTSNHNTEMAAAAQQASKSFRESGVIVKNRAIG